MTIHRHSSSLAACSADICIIGAGAAGITMACELDGSGLRVLLLDAGAPDSDPDAIDTYAGTADAPHAVPAEFRRIGFGGTTRIWGGRCVPFDPIDFERRDYVPNSGWPIGYDDVVRYYPRALAYCHAGNFEFAVADALDRPIPTIPGLGADNKLLMDRIERYSLPTHFGREYRKRLAQSSNVDVVQDSRCLRLHTHTDGRTIESAEVVDGLGARRSVVARLFVVAVGGIETPRLLFASDPEGPGLGNRRDRLGRFYACHVENVFARLVTRPGTSVAFDFEKTRDGVYARRKLQFTAETQRDRHLLNTTFRLHFPDYSDASHRSAVMSAIFLAKSTLLPEYQAILRHGVDEHVVSSHWAHIGNALRGLPQLSAFGSRWLFQRVLARRKLPYTLIANADGSYPIEFNAEQIPLEDSRIVLGPDTDRHGIRRVHVQWRISKEDVEAGERAFRTLRAAVNATQNCRVEFAEEQLAAGLRNAVPVGGHHLGTARMASSDRNGVVDRDCAVFGIPNLFLAGAATFPTSSHANPTLTIVALAIRLAETLRARC